MKSDIGISQKDVVELYAYVLKLQRNNFPYEILNRLIIKAWSYSGLKGIKDKAWKKCAEGA